MTGWRNYEKRVLGLALTIGVLTGHSVHAFGGLDEQHEVVDEIVVVGTPPGSIGFSVIGGWFSFAAVDLSEQFRSLDRFLDSLSDLNDALMEASEQYCSQKIENWRGACHDGMGTAHTYCIVSGAFLTGTFVRGSFPAPFRSSGSIGSGFGALTTCNEIRFRAHENCDRIADSDVAPRIAQCPGE